MPRQPTAFVELNSSACFLDMGPDTFAPIVARYPHIRFVFLSSPEDLAARIDEPDIVVTWSFASGLYGRAARLRHIFTPAAGRDWVAEDPSGRVQVHHGAFHGRMMAETLLGMILFFNCRFHNALRNQAAHLWDRDSRTPPRLLDKQHVLLVGYGAIGRHCGRSLRPLGCSMAGLQRTRADGVDEETGVRYALFERLTEELSTADHVVLLLPGGEGTRRIISRRHLSAMKPTAYLYNLGRGTVVDEADLVWALESGVIAGAGLDVFEQEPLPPESPLWDLSTVLILPHASAGYDDYGALYVEELSRRMQEAGL